MKYLLLAALFASHSLFAAQAPKVFADIPWGSDPADVARAMEAKGAKPGKPAKEGAADVLPFTEGQLAGRAAKTWELFFEKGKFSGARVAFKPDGPAEDQFRKLKASLSELYGTAGGKQVGHRKPGTRGRFGWRSGAVVKPELSAEWVASSALERREVEIKLWVVKGVVFVQYTNGDDDAPAPKKSATDDAKKDL